MLQQVAELQTKVRELSTRRSGASLTIKEANLYKQAAKQSTQAAAKQRSRLNEFWASEREADRELEKAQAALADATATMQELQEKLKEAQQDVARFKAVAEPTKARFKTGNHFSAEVDLAIVSVLSLGVARKKVPKLFPIFARLFGITLPGRDINVPGPIVDGKRTYVIVNRHVLHTPGATHCKEMASIMYQVNKLQVSTPSPLTPPLPVCACVLDCVCVCSLGWQVAP